MNKSTDKTLKTPSSLCVISLLIILCYAVCGVLTNQLKVGTLICTLIIAIPIQLFLHIYINNSIKKENYSGLAGYDSKIKYNNKELNNMLAKMNFYISLMSTIYIILMCIVSFIQINSFSLDNLLMFLYVIEFILTIIILNYKFLSKLYSDNKDIEKAKMVWPISIGYVIILAISMIETYIIFELNHIDNNTTPALIIGGILIIAVICATIGMIKENNRISKWCCDEDKYRISIISLICFVLTVIYYIIMPFVI